MKMIMKTFLFTFLFMATITSCNKEELFVEPEVEIVEEDTEDTDEPGTTTPTAVDTNAPCDFTLSGIQANTTVIINCVMDLEGETIDLPANVTIVYEGGDIINGTLNFSEGSEIDGEILNSTLIIGGTTPLLRDTTFNFDAKRWGIVEGQVSDETAANNTKIINEIITLSKEMGINTLQIDNIDAYFDVATETGSPRHDEEASIFIPSDYHLKMGGNCNLRVQPNGVAKSVLILSRDTENVMISGGKLWGDRYTHDYNTLNSTHEWGHIIMFRGVQNSVVDGVEMHEGTGDGFEIGGIEHRNNDGSLKPHGRESKNVTVKNCLINDNRRNNISIVDGVDLYFEYNTISNSGSGITNEDVINSNGISPRAGIDIEAFKSTDFTNKTVWDWELTENIHIRNNVFENNFAVDIAIFNGEKTYIYENTFRSRRGIGSSFGYNNKIYNNTFERPAGLMSGSHAINLEPVYWPDGTTHRVTDFEIYGNNVSGYQYGIIMGGKDHIIKDNSIINCQRGITLLKSVNLEFDNNTITTDVNNSYGYFTFSVESSKKNCLIKNGETNLPNGTPLFFSNVNNDEEGDITIDNIDFNGRIRIENVKNITIKNSTFSQTKIVNSNPTFLNNN